MRSAGLFLTLWVVVAGCVFRAWPPEAAFGGAVVTAKGVEASQMGADAFQFLLRVIDAIPGVEVNLEDRAAGPGQCDRIMLNNIDAGSDD